MMEQILPLFWIQMIIWLIVIRIAHNMKALRFLFFTYLILWIFEGSLRKWILPGLSNPLLIVRDPIVVMIYLLAFKQGIFPTRPALTALYVIAAFALLFSLAFGIASPDVLFFGLRTDFLHIPLIFLIPQILRKDDLVSIARLFSILSWPMAFLMVAQFMAPGDSWLNKGASGAESGQIDAAMGHIRPAGFFSYNTGAGQFLALTAAFLFGGWINKSYSLKFILPTMLAVLMSTLCSGSRTTVISIGIVALVFIGTFFHGKNFWRGVAALVLLSGAVFFASRLGSTSEGLETLSTRFTQAEAAQSSSERIMSGFTSAWTHAGLTGVGLGVGTNAGAKLLTGDLVFLVSEGEWGRVIGESGFLVGTAFIIWRTWLLLLLLMTSARAFIRSQPLAILIFAAVASIVWQGQWGQATTLGFAVIGAGFCLLASQETGPAPVIPRSMAVHGPSVVRGRSKLAEELHGK